MLMFQALRCEADEYRVTLASMKGTQHRLAHQLEAVCAQLQTSTEEKHELTRELEEVHACVCTMLCATDDSVHLYCRCLT